MEVLGRSNSMTQFWPDHPGFDNWRSLAEKQATEEAREDVGNPEIKLLLDWQGSLVDYPFADGYRDQTSQIPDQTDVYVLSWVIVDGSP